MSAVLYKPVRMLSVSVASACRTWQGHHLRFATGVVERANALAITRDTTGVLWRPRVLHN